MSISINYLVVLLGVCFVSCGLQAIAQNCGGQVRVRKEIHDLSNAEWNRFMNALQRLKERAVIRESGLQCDAMGQLTTVSRLMCQTRDLLTSINQLDSGFVRGQMSSQLTEIFDNSLAFRCQNNSAGSIVLEQSRRGQQSFDDFSLMHRRHRATVHRSSLFLPWHRRFIYEFESALRDIDSEVTLPYWDWSLEARNPQNSIIWSWFGSSAASFDESGSCVPNGPFRNWRMSNAIDPGETDCIRRSFDPRTGESFSGAVTGSGCVNRIISGSGPFPDFRSNLEAIHDWFHGWMGGSMIDVRIAANDPIFYLHHAYVDMLWDRWQRRNSRSARSYNSNPNTILPGFQERVRDVMISNCVQYQLSATTESGASNSIPPKPLPGSGFQMGVMNMSMEHMEILERGIEELCT